MSLTHALIITMAGLAAGTINTIVGSGSLITFPTLLFLGFPPVSANISNNIGLVAGGITGSFGYRKEISGRGDFLRRNAPLSFLGAVVGAVLLLVLPASAFRAIVPVLIAIALVLVIGGPALQRRAKERDAAVAEPSWHRWAIAMGVFVAGIYGGYFGAAQGVLLMGILSVLTVLPLQTLNGFKNVLALVVNAVAAATFMIIAWDQIDWAVAGLIGFGSLLGGVVGSKIGRRLPPVALRAFIVAIGVVAMVKMIWFP